MSDNSAIPEAWICEHCGNIATGAMCMQCGATVPSRPPPGPEPGSYFNIVGFHTFEGFKAYGLLVGLCTFGLGVVTQSIGFSLLGMILLTPFLLPTLARFWGWVIKLRQPWKK